MKKIVTILLAGLMCGAILAGCGNSEDPKQVLKGYSDSETYSDKEDITGYFQDFDTWGTTSSFSDHYDFKTDMITEGDYYCIADENVNVSSVGQRKAVKIYHKYSVYYYDTESHTLYYIHNNLNES